MKNLINFYGNQHIPLIKDWNDPFEFLQDTNKYIFVKYIKDSLNLDENDILPYFDMSKKRGYGNENLKIIIVNYINYFLTYFDTDKELLDIYRCIKIKCDYLSGNYNTNEFYADMCNYILSPCMLQKISYMNEYNLHSIIDDSEKTKNIHDSLLYNSNHKNILYNISLIMKISIPLLAHYIFARNENVLSIPDFLMKYYNIIFDIFDVNIKRKLISTVENLVNSSTKSDFYLWEKQSIQGINSVTYTISALTEIITGVLPKIKYDKDGYSLIYTSTKNNIENGIKSKVYPFEYMKIGGNLKNSTEFDKFEIGITNSSESLLIYSQANSDITIEMLSKKYHIDNHLIEHYYRELSENGENIINPFQEKLIRNLFYKYYGECISINNTNSINYIRLMLIAKEILLSEKLYLLAEIISSKVISMSSRKDLNKKEKSLLETSELYNAVMQKYNNDQKIVTDIRSMIATVITSEFKVIDPMSDLYGTVIPILPVVVIYQILSFVLLI